MMKFLHVKRYSDAERSKAELILREKKDRMSPKVKETYIKKSGIICIYGAEASGKSKMVTEMYVNAREVWRCEPMILRATDSLSEIIHKNLREDAGRYVDEEMGDASRQYVQIAALVEKAREAVVFIDDADRFTGKKLDVLKEILRSAKRIILSAKSENSLNKTIRETLRKRRMKEQVIDLQTAASFDATNWLFGVLIVGLFVGGLPEAAMLIMAMRLMQKGVKA